MRMLITHNCVTQQSPEHSLNQSPGEFLTGGNNAGNRQKSGKNCSGESDRGEHVE